MNIDCVISGYSHVTAKCSYLDTIESGKPVGSMPETVVFNEYSLKKNLHAY